MKTLCPCRQCRPRGMSLRAAMRRATRAAEVARFTPAELARRDAEKRARLRELEERRAG